MTDEKPKDPTRPASVQDQVTSKSPPKTDTTVPPVDPQGDANQLTPEEQMARFEKELKENDWGHQPC